MSPSETAANGDSASKGSARVGPHPGIISSGNQFSTEAKLRSRLRDNGCDPSRETQYRLQGVQLIDNVREHLHLPVRTFDTACVYFHKFRLNFRDAEYNYQDAALASLFVACKVEDTIKKSKDILAAAYNMKNPDKPTAPDDKAFDAPSKIIIGLERLILETIGFDFRTRYPQKLLAKVVRRLMTPSPSDPHDDPQAARAFFSVAYAMSVDMYKTFVPVKRTTFAMVMAIVELTARVVGGAAHVLEKIRALAAEKARRYTRVAVTETMLDLLDLYVGHAKSTKVGPRFDQSRWMDITIQINNDREKESRPRYLNPCPRCEEDPKIATPSTPFSTTSPATGDSDAGGGGAQQLNTGKRTMRGQEGTVRFMSDPKMARAEMDAAHAYFHEEFEEYEVEVDEPVPPPPRREDDGPRGRGRRGRGGMGGSRGYGRDRWGGPYGGYRGDRGHGSRGRYH